LEDLKAACAELSPRDPTTQEFEVGVFCGTYVTPVKDGYFEHLERIRGETRKLKVLESAKEAVLHGVAGEKELNLVTRGAVVNSEGQIVPDGHEDKPVNGTVNGSVRPKLETAESTTPPVRDRQDISLHNFASDTSRGYE